MTTVSDPPTSDPQLAPTPAKAVVFDLGNVLVVWDPQPAIAKEVGQEEASRFLQDFDFMAWNHQQDAGRPWDIGEEVAAAAYPHWEPAIRAYRANFGDSLVREVEDTVQLLRELHAAGIPLYGLTNWSAELFPEAIRRFDFLDLFEDVIVSGHEGFAKPDPEIFEILQDRIGHSLTDCIFVDDGPINIAAAVEAGLDAILFTDTGHLRADLLLRGMPLSPGID